MVTLLWNEKVAELPNKIPDEDFPILENRITDCLDGSAILLCASLLGFSVADTSQLASVALAQEIRKREGVPELEGLRRYEVENPSSPMQTLKINDPTLYSEQIVISSLEDFDEAYTKFDQLARSYWKSVGDKKLYTLRDIASLKKWKVIKEARLRTELPPTLLLIGGKQVISPLQKLDKALAEWLSTKLKFSQHYEMAFEIGRMGTDLSIRGLWPPFDVVAVDKRGEWLARIAAKTLNLPPEFGEAYNLTWKKLDDFLLKYLLLDFQSPTGILPESGNTEVSVAIAQTAVLPSVNHLIFTQFEFSMNEVYGGTKLRFNSTSFPEIDIDTDSYRRTLISEGVRIKNEILRNPRIYDNHLKKLRTWRDTFERSFIQLRKNDPQHIRNFYRQHWDAISAEAEEIRSALANVERINEIQKILDSILKRIGSESTSAGKIAVPFDVRIDSVLVSEGEYLSEGSPVLTTTERFRCKARAFITAEKALSLNLMPMSVWKIAIDGIDSIGAKISFACIVERIEPQKQDTWVIDANIVAIVSLDSVEVSNLPTVLPLSTRYLDPVVPEISEDSLIEAERHLAIKRAVAIEFILRLL